MTYPLNSTRWQGECFGPIPNTETILRHNHYDVIIRVNNHTIVPCVANFTKDKKILLPCEPGCSGVTVPAGEGYEFRVTGDSDCGWVCYDVPLGIFSITFPGTTPVNYDVTMHGENPTKLNVKLKDILEYPLDVNVTVKTVPGYAQCIANNQYWEKPGLVVFDVDDLTSYPDGTDICDSRARSRPLSCQIQSCPQIHPEDGRILCQPFKDSPEKCVCVSENCSQVVHSEQGWDCGSGGCVQAKPGCFGKKSGVYSSLSECQSSCRKKNG